MPAFTWLMAASDLKCGCRKWKSRQIAPASFVTNLSRTRRLFVFVFLAGFHARFHMVNGCVRSEMRLPEMEKPANCTGFFRNKLIQDQKIICVRVSRRLPCPLSHG